MRRRALSGMGRPLRIVQVTETLDVGGLERMAVDLALAEKAAGHEPLLYCMFEPGTLAPEARAAGIPVVPFHKTPGASPRTLLALARRLRHDRPHVVHTHNPGVHPYAAVAARLGGVPVTVNTRHGPATSRGLAYRERYFRAVMPFTAQVVFVCEDSRRFLVEERGVSKRKASVIVNGIDVRKFVERPAAPGSRRPRLRFGTVGRMVPVKAHALLIEAFARIATIVPGAELRIVGGGPLQGELSAQAASLGLTDRIRLEPLHRNPAEVLQELDVFVLSSISEGLPLVILEAMAAGLPIVSTRVGGVAEVAPEGDVAWFCPPGRSDALADAMLEACRSEDLAARGRLARRLASDRHGIGRMCDTYLALFERLLSCR